MSIAAARLVAVAVRELGVGPGAGLQDLARAVHDRALAVDRARADRRPLVRRRGRACAWSVSGPASNSLPFGSTNMNGYSGILRRRVGHGLPRVGRRVVDLRQRVGGVDQRHRRASVLGSVPSVMSSPETTNTRPSGSVVAVGYQRGDGHVGAARPRVGRRVEEVRVLRALVGLDVAAGDEQAPVGERDVAGAEQVAAVRDRVELAASTGPTCARSSPRPRSRPTPPRGRPGSSARCTGVIGHADRLGELADRRPGRCPTAAAACPATTGGSMSVRDLARGQRAVVDPDLVDQAAEVLAPDVVGADRQRAGAVGAARRRAALEPTCTPLTYRRRIVPS